MSLVLQELTVKSSRLKKFTKEKRPANKNYMSIEVSVRTTTFAARNNGIRVRQESIPQPATAYSSVRCTTHLGV